MHKAGENLCEIVILKSVKIKLVEYILASRFHVSFGEQKHILSA